MKRTIEEYKDLVYNITDGEYSVLSTIYVNNKEHLLHKHNICGYKWMISANKFIQGRRCPSCNGNIKLSYYKIRRNIYKKFKGLILSYDPKISKFNDKTKLKFIYKECKHINYFSYNQLMHITRSHICKVCNASSNSIISIEKFHHFINKDPLRKNDFIVENVILDNNVNKYVIRHLICNATFKQTHYEFFNRRKHCPNCMKNSKSSGIDTIKNVLINRSIDFITEYKIPTLNGKSKSLKLDIFIPSYNICIEYDGCQHFNQSKNSMMYESYLNNIKYDFIKNNYFYSNDTIILLRICYKLEGDALEDFIDELIKYNFNIPLLRGKYNNYIAVLYNYIDINMEHYYERCNKNYFNKDNIKIIEDAIRYE